MRIWIKFINKIKIKYESNKIISHQDYINVNFTFKIEYAPNGIKSIKLVPYGVDKIYITVEETDSFSIESKLINVDFSKIQVYNEARPDEFDLITVGGTFIVLDNNLNVNYDESYIISLI